ncbi:hypothetical protein PENTCL1PPCAC_3042, partial [Pristionchus entomophagus]
MRPKTSKRKSNSGVGNLSELFTRRSSSSANRSNTNSGDESSPDEPHGRPARVPISSQSIVVPRAVRSARSDKGSSSRKVTASDDIENEPEEEPKASSPNADFKKLILLCLPRWGKKYTKRKKNDPDLEIKDDAVDVEVATRKTEGWRVWDRMYALARSNVGFVIDYIVATGPRSLGEIMAKQFLIKFSQYPIPSWEERKKVDGTRTQALEMCRIRCHDLDFIEIQLRKELGDDVFEKLFPSRYLEPKTGSDAGGYVEDERSLYKNDLRALESLWAYICARAGLPTLYIEDWTEEPFDLKPLMAFEFMVYLVNSPFVADFIKEYDQLKEMKCDFACSSCTRKNHRDEQTHCCGMETSFDVDQMTGEFQWCDKRETHHLEHCNHFECIDDCSCGEPCRNRSVQRGRQMVLCVFREPGKGWGVRTVSEIDQCKFVTEYIGEVNEKGMTGRKSVYDFEMAYPARDSEGREVHKKFIISAGEKGNESRFFNHSCAPNMNPMTTIIERYGLFYNHVAFFTCRKILPGEELVFDYWPDQHPSDIDISRMFPNGCQCISSECRIPHKTTAYKGTSVEWEAKEVKEEEEDGIDGDDEADLMIADDDDFGGSSMRDENEDDGNDPVSSPVHSPPARTKNAGSENKKKSGRSKMEESGDEEDERRKEEKENEKRRRHTLIDISSDIPYSQSIYRNHPDIQAPPDSSRLARKAVGTG